MTSFGYGKKHDFTKGNRYPAPNKYDKRSFVYNNKTKGKGITFGVSRSVIS
jgi:hypothetical protein